MKIEKLKNKPKSKQGRPYKYPYLDMKVRDSFKVKAGKGEDLLEVSQKMYSSVSYTNEKLSPKVFKCSKQDGHVLVWRVK